MELEGVARTVPGRTCGSCMMCCKVPHIEEFDKPPGVWCRHAIAGRGCAIYADRPSPCRSFYCLWMQDARLGPEWKPDRAKFVVYVQRNGVNLQVAVDPGFPNAWTKAPYYDHLKRCAREGAGRGAFVFVRIGQRMVAMLPEQDRDLGTVALDDDVVVTRRFTPSGYVYDVAVKRRAAPDASTVEADAENHLIASI
jgi:hypothetical protein